MTQALRKAFEQVPDNREIHLKPGTYHFSASQGQQFFCALSNSDPFPCYYAAILLKNRRHLVLDFHGATLLLHGQLTPIALLDCCDITIRNLSIDWDISLTAEGTIQQVTDHFADVHVDATRFPFHIQQETLYFDGGDWSQALCPWGHTEFDPEENRVAYRRGERFLSDRQIMLPDGSLRFYGDFSGEYPPTQGNILVLRHGPRNHPGLLIHHSANVSIESLKLFGSGGLGILGQFSENLSFSGVEIVPNRKRGRRFAGGHDDGIHLSAVSGHVQIENCRFLGLMDDPVNLHGIAAQAVQQIDAHKWTGKFLHPQSRGHRLWAEPGHRVAFLNGDTMEELAQATVEEYHLLSDDTFEIRFREALSPPCQNLSMENMSQTASLTVKNSFFGSCRARGLLCCTPRKVEIFSNTFESAGAAIRIAGDVCTWYESGRCRDVTIRDNLFEDSCLTSHYQGGEGIISISPELPRPDVHHPCHRNIRISGNTFHTSDSRILFARCTENLSFSDNHIQKSGRYPWTQGSEGPVTLEFCSHTSIK